MRKDNPYGPQSKRYLVGKGRPPLATRWKPGQSGNPKGRRKGRKNLMTILEESLDKKVKIQENGKIRSITVRDAIAKGIIRDALKGDHKTRMLVLEYEPEIARNAQVISARARENLPRAEREKRAAEAYFRIIKGT